MMSVLTTGNLQPSYMMVKQFQQASNSDGSMTHASYMAPVNRGKPFVHLSVPHQSTAGHPSGYGQARTVSAESMTMP